MKFSKYLIILILLLMLFPERVAASGGVSSSSAEAGATDSLRVSIVTCWPGPEVYELVGHEAIRISCPANDSIPGFDYVWNYGTFDFNQPNFIGRFVSGQTDYKVISYPFEYFLPEYQRRGSRVEEQELRLTPREKRALLEALKRNALPENATYRYNYVKDNCATRITAMLDSTSDRRIIFPDSTRYGTFRKVMRHYHRDYPWYQLGIDLVLGSGLDGRISRRAEMFAPVEMHDAFAKARFAENGGPVVGSTQILNEGNPHPTLPPTPWYLTPLAVSLYALVITGGVWGLWYIRRRLARWWYSVYFGICGIAGCLVTYLVFFSTHEATSPNLFILWLNPLQLLIGLGIWWRSWRSLALAMSLYNVVALPILLLIWPTQLQSGSAPIFIFMGICVLLSLLYIIISLKYSYYNNRLASNELVYKKGLTTRKSTGSSNRSNPSKPTRKTTSRGGRNK